jgi:hypothetical protein
MENMLGIGMRAPLRHAKAVKELDRASSYPTGHYRSAPSIPDPARHEDYLSLIANFA